MFKSKQLLNSELENTFSWQSSSCKDDQVWRKGLPVPQRIGKEILCTVFRINLSRYPPVSCPAQTNSTSWWKQSRNLHISHSGYFILTQCLFLTQSVSLCLSSVFSLPHAFILSFFLPLFLLLACSLKGIWQTLCSGDVYCITEWLMGV